MINLPLRYISFIALWVLYLMKVKNTIPSQNLKFPTVEDFLNAYTGVFSGQTTEEIRALWQTANWMHELFKMVKAEKNKGLAM